MKAHAEEWEHLLFAAAKLQQLVPGCVLAGGSAAAVHAEHRFSKDADHVLVDLENPFEDLLAFLGGNHQHLPQGFHCYRRYACRMTPNAMRKALTNCKKK